MSNIFIPNLPNDIWIKIINIEMNRQREEKDIVDYWIEISKPLLEREHLGDEICDINMAWEEIHEDIIMRPDAIEIQKEEMEDPLFLELMDEMREHGDDGVALRGHKKQLWTNPSQICYNGMTCF
jgi:hypothetical protein